MANEHLMHPYSGHPDHFPRPGKLPAGLPDGCIPLSVATELALLAKVREAWEAHLASRGQRGGAPSLEDRLRAILSP